MRGMRLDRRLTGASLLSLLLACGGAEPAAPVPPVASTPVASAKPAPRMDPKLVPRDTLFGNTEHTGPGISPDGKWLAYIAPVDGVMNVMVVAASTPLDLEKAKPMTHDETRPVFQYSWALVPGKLLYMQDAAGDENFHVHVVDVATGKEQDLTPYAGANAEIVGASLKHPNELLVAINDRDPKYADVYRIDLATAKRSLVQKNDGFEGFEVDDDLALRIAYRAQPDGSRLAFTASKPGTFDRAFLTIPFDDAQTTSVVGFDDTGKTLYLVDSRNRDTAGLVAMDFATKKTVVLAEDPKADTGMLLRHPRTHRPLIAGSEYDRVRHTVLDRSVQADEDYLKKVVPDADVQWGNCTTAFDRCIVDFVVSDGPVRYYLYDRTKKRADFLFLHRPKLESVPLARMTPEVLTARDGLSLVSYLTLPVGSNAKMDGRPDHPLPMVLLVHGGPWARDSWGLNGMHQWLANRGYAVLSVNFRGSTGFGKKFLNAANLEWGGKMQDDLDDAVAWAARSGIADPAKIGIFGGSYGGYAALVGMSFTPDTFACGVDEVGVANLVTFQETIPPAWDSFRPQLYLRVGDPRTQAGKKLLLDRSPITHVDAIKRPLLVAQGLTDPRVNHHESEQIVEAMKSKGTPVTYLLFPDEGHGFHRPENNKAFNAVTEIFLAQCLGGSYEPVGHSFDGSTITVPAGADQIHGLATVLPAR